jgi:hypothetical protein
MKLLVCRHRRDARFVNEAYFSFFIIAFASSRYGLRYRNRQTEVYMLF